MDEIICAGCYSRLEAATLVCPGCGTAIYWKGNEKNVIDQLQPNCLIHRYEGSDMLEPAVALKQGKTNYKAATKIKEYAKPITVPKSKVYALDHTILNSIQTLRNERTATIHRYDQLIQSHWQQLKPFKP